MKAYIFLTLVMLMFSGNLIVGKAISELPPFTIAFFRIFIAFLVMLPVGIGQWQRNRAVFRKEWKPFLGLAVTGIALFNALIYMALRYTSSTNVAIVETTTPVFTIGLGILFLKERLTALQSIGVTLSLAGAVWVISGGSLEALVNFSFNRGDLIMLAAVLVWSVYSVLVKRHNHKFPMYGGLVGMLGVAVVTLFPFALYEWIRFSPQIFNAPVAMGLLYLGIFPSVIALLLYNHAVSEIGPSTSSVFFNLLPVFTMVGAVLLLDETVKNAQLIGGALVIGGVYLTTRRKRERSKFGQSSVSAGESK